MATNTPNLGLTKPATTEAYSVGVQNANMDKIDGKIASLENTLTRMPTSGTTTTRVDFTPQNTLAPVFGVFGAPGGVGGVYAYIRGTLIALKSWDAVSTYQSQETGVVTVVSKTGVNISYLFVQ